MNWREMFRRPVTDCGEWRRIKEEYKSYIFVRGDWDWGQGYEAGRCELGKMEGWAEQILRRRVAEMGEATVVDLGGGFGWSMTQLARMTKKNPNDRVNFVVTNYENPSSPRWLAEYLAGGGDKALAEVWLTEDMRMLPVMAQRWIDQYSGVEFRDGVEAGEMLRTSGLEPGSVLLMVDKFGPLDQRIPRRSEILRGIVSCLELGGYLMTTSRLIILPDKLRMVAKEGVFRIHRKV